MKTTKTIFKNKIIHALILFFLLLIIISCPPVNNDNSTTSSNNNQLPGNFWAINVNTSYYYRVSATLQYSGLHCNIYVENAELSAIPVSLATQIAAEFDSNAIGSYTGIHGLDNTLFGLESDVNGDGKVTILILNIGSYVAGYFNPADLLAYDPNFNPCTNSQEILYLDSNNSHTGYTPGTNSFYATIAHEFQHMINFNQKVFIQGGNESQTWLNEGLSTQAEYEYGINKTVGYYTDTDINNYISDFDGLSDYNFLSWQQIYDNYAADFVFFQWLRVQSSDGDGIYKAIINDYRKVDTNAVVDIAQTTISGHGSTWTTWGDLLRCWYIANYFQNSSTIYGYKSDNIVNPTYNSNLLNIKLLFLFIASNHFFNAGRRYLC